jgi:predicted unusual protein kinase regulating ubiquinone biosynthesis (AarF/ABC1/UbiB family)
VHSAVLDGKRVAVKVRHPGVAEQIELDFRLMRKVRICVYTDV